MSFLDILDLAQLFFQYRILFFQHAILFFQLAILFQPRAIFFSQSLLRLFQHINLFLSLLNLFLLNLDSLLQTIHFVITIPVTLIYRESFIRILYSNPYPSVLILHHMSPSQFFICAGQIIILQNFQFVCFLFLKHLVFQI